MAPAPRDARPSVYRFDEAFGGKGDNVTRLIGRVAKNKELPDFVWTNAVLTKCGETGCAYCE